MNNIRERNHLRDPLSETQLKALRAVQERGGTLTPEDRKAAGISVTTLRRLINTGHVTRPPFPFRLETATVLITEKGKAA